VFLLSTSSYKIFFHLGRDELRRGRRVHSSRVKPGLAQRCRAQKNDSDNLGVDLQFQDFGDTRTTSGSIGGQHEQTITFTDFPDTPEEELEQEKLLGEEDEEKPAGLKPGTGFWTFEFYQQFFNVESKQVGDRILWSMVPKPGVSYLQSYIRPNPDLYGPFWICMTLTFTTAITGNLANYLGTSPEDTYIWRYDFHKVTLAATAIFSYAWLVPLAMWGIIVWRGSRAKISLLELLCLYGYSLSIFVPVSILWIVPQPWFKWCLAIVAPVLSGSVLVRTVWPSLSHDAKQIAIGIAVFILVLHATLALGFMLYFFAAPDKAMSSNVIPVQPVSNKPIVKDQTVAPTKRQTDNSEQAMKSIANEVNTALAKEPGGDKEKKDVSNKTSDGNISEGAQDVGKRAETLNGEKGAEVAPDSLKKEIDVDKKVKKSDSSIENHFSKMKPEKADDASKDSLPTSQNEGKSAVKSAATQAVMVEKPKETNADKPNSHVSSQDPKNTPPKT
ncbi:Yip1 member 1, partial [Halocaridina rubra]